MDRVAWWATVHSIAESDTTEATEHTCRRRGQLTGKNSRGSGWNTNTLLQGNCHSLSFIKVFTLHADVQSGLWTHRVWGGGGRKGWDELRE